MASAPSSPAINRRRRPRSVRGQGGRLREEIIGAAAELLDESGVHRQLTLRAVARKVGIAATSVYLHFPDVDHLMVAVAHRRFAELTRRQEASEREVADPAEALLARCRAYCQFALQNPSHYRVMFVADLGPSMTIEFEDAPGRASFQSLVRAITHCIDAGVAPSGDPVRLATLVWAMEHGLASLRISRPRFPWPPLDGLVDDAVRRIVGLGQETIPRIEPKRARKRNG